ncbi:hypothetical protein TRFO_41777 [Tritrichomonas foetus]|uniref:Surface antigen BspA-like n=1 Tax=Tritrichomonas foetus TaxID=1144522 RepID=A0A1J4KZC2_9EUKA|nr:hypothetical protein TRFO_41777 [Tritrichomonas foetus]|eukprot:OHT16506.1 hypothetical protein TRFO_41777 [Tritrichomonas foetus]
MLFFFFLFSNSQFKVQINDCEVTSDDSISQAVKNCGLSPTIVEKILILDGTLPKSELKNETTSLSKLYPNIAEFHVLDNSKIEDNVFPPETFKHSLSIKKVTISILEAVGRDAFYNCTHLKEFKCEALSKIGINAFRFCHNLTSLSFPHLIKIDNYGFMNCSNLQEILIPNVEFLGCNVFHRCFKLHSLNLPKCTFIGTECFRQSGIENITLNNNLTHLGIGAFYNCTSLKCDLTFPSLTKLMTDTFTDCHNLSFVSGPKIIEIGNNCFWNCTGLKTAIFPNVVTIKYQAFYNTIILSNIDLPLLENIESYGFWKSAIQNFSSNSLINLGQQAFRDCLNLTAVSIPQITMLGHQTFDNCHSLQKVDAHSATLVSDFGFRNCHQLNKLNLTSVTFVGDFSFTQTTLETINIPHLKVVGNYSFMNSNLKVFEFNELEFVGCYAFKNSKNLKKIYIPSSAHFNETALIGCTSLKNVTFLGIADINKCSNMFSSSKLSYFKTNTYYNNLNLNLQNDAIVIISKSNNYVSFGSEYHFQEGATRIDDGALSNYKSIQYLFIPNSVHTIGNHAFESMTSLIDISFSKQLNYVGSFAFKDCVSLCSIKLPKTVEKVGDGLFSGCLKLTSVDLLCLLSELKEHVFENCPSLKIVVVSSRLKNCFSTVPESTVVRISNPDGVCPQGSSLNVPSFVTEIYENAYSSCNNLKAVYIPLKVNKIGDKAFYGCSNAIEFQFEEPSNIKYIGNKAFSLCTSLENIKLPSNLIDVGFDVFYGDTALETVDVPLTLDIGKYYSNIFNGNNATIYVATKTPESTEMPSNLSTVEIVGITIGSISGVIIIVILILQKKKRDNNNQFHTLSQGEYTNS